MSRRKAVIALTHSEWLSGAEKDLLEVVTSLRDEYQFELVMPTAVGSLRREVEAKGISVHAMRMPSWVYGGRPPLALAWWWSLLVFQMQFFHRLAQSGPSYVHCNSVKAAILAFLPSLLTRTPLVLHQHDILGSSRSTRALLYVLDAVVHRYIAVSRAVAENLTSLGAAPEKIDVVYNYLYGEWTRRADGDAATLRRELSFEPGEVCFVSVGQLAEWKGVDLIIRAFSGVVRAGVRGRLLIAGGPLGADAEPYAAGLRHLTSALGLEDKVQFLGFRSDAALLLEAADVYIHGARRPDPFPLTVIEALAAGTCVVASELGGIPEVVEHGVNGLLYPAGEVDALEAALLSVSRDPSMRERLGKEGEQTIRVRFDGARNLEHLRSALRRVSG
jgi:glycosyltransferase involved in cell wall biosynthesis